ncbi:unnamed protein product [Urochloa humidicola]
MLSDRRNATEVMKQLLEMPEEKQMKVVTLLWNWWLERNRVREGDSRRRSSELAAIAAKQADEFPTIGRMEGLQTTKARGHWKRPAQDTLKINTDGAFCPHTKQGGWGFVIRDEGQVINAGAGQCPFLMDALHAEMLACLMGIKVAGELGVSKVEVETDSMMVKLALESSSFSLAPTGAIAFEIKSLISLCFASCKVSFCPRDYNKVAHAVAAQGCKCPQNSALFWEGTPPGVEDQVASDLAASIS